MKIFVLLLLNVTTKRVNEADKHAELENPAKTLVSFIFQLGENSFLEKYVTER